ncbi:MAG: DedA family protein [Candidatus Thermoplasmatota archaeon]|nr:DedA family protein [Candidatus Thermoplasmatota archaeon]
MSIVEWGTSLILNWISDFGYVGIALLMALESACMPVPSEIVMPFAGYLVYQADTDPLYDGTVMSLVGITLAGAFGCTLGSILAYFVGKHAGRPLILKYGRYVLLRKKHLDLADRWFEKYGEAATFIARLLPVVRTFISLPAGIARMDFKKFVFYSFAGSLPWTAMLAYVGYALGPRWEDIVEFFHGLDALVIAVVVVIVVYYAYKLRKDGLDDDAEEQKPDQS